MTHLTLGEQNINLKIKGQGYHNELIIAEAQLTQATKEIYQKQNQLPENFIIYLQCKWFTVNKYGVQTPIEGVNSGFYQISYEDIGQKILVQATPILEDFEYIGNPLQAEIGPIQESPSFAKDNQNLIQQNDKTEFILKLDNVQYAPFCAQNPYQLQNQKIQKNNSIILNSPLNKQSQLKLKKNSSSQQQQNKYKIQDLDEDQIDNLCNADYPKDCFMVINSDYCKLKIMDLKLMKVEIILEIELCSKFPNIQMIKKTNNAFIFELSQEISCRMKAVDNNQRDLVAFFIKKYMTDNILNREYNRNNNSDLKLKSQDNLNALNDVFNKQDNDLDLQQVHSFKQQNQNQEQEQIVEERLRSQSDLIKFDITKIRAIFFDRKNKQ
ncbi:hypothetical protein PPERSA_12970 [Pseudocohnilembus persalinus]|uniref:Uncharacterized protein n=1 Tax=Pseudocohnilembus persalinus TaxID=266149 RepID=A0A0V0R1T8_PSEPJ|nr:hypothetical protein PPERSA_12970 [Pseudocohnilembus persalinus]|eukprot:KRX08489.1 hypothetical protein PPERSA_12970 [Pseudocohnilembus persalinus]